jgi:N-acetylglucosaminyldiphosphoundecaprenol N-acetyl-beta-D-mannosaminyltransferase
MPPTTCHLPSPEPRPLNPVDRIVVLGLPLARLDYGGTLDEVDRLIERGQPAFFITANLHYARLSDRDPRLAAVNRQAAFLVADGMPLVWVSRLGPKPLPERVAGSDLIFSLCQRAAQRGYRVFFLGGAAGVAERAAERLCRDYPGLQVAGIEAPELDRLSPREHADLTARIRRAAPDLLLVAFGQPKGELWLAENYRRLGVPACVQVGASFDFAAGRMARAPRWVRRVGLEWLYRMAREPGRLAGRYGGDAWFLVKALTGRRRSRAASGA